MFLSVEITQSHDNLYYAACPELALVSKGNTQAEAITNLKTDIFVQYAKESVEFSDIKFVFEAKQEKPTVH